MGPGWREQARDYETAGCWAETWEVPRFGLSRVVLPLHVHLQMCFMDARLTSPIQIYSRFPSSSHPSYSFALLRGPHSSHL